MRRMLVSEAGEFPAALAALHCGIASAQGQAFEGAELEELVIRVRIHP